MIRRRLSRAFLYPRSGRGPTTTRYYAYGPGYVDELVAQVETRSDYPGVANTHYYLQDGNYNVTAMVDLNGDVVRQYAYTPYGEPMVSESFGVSPPTNAIGHQGLFFYRLDGTPSSDTTCPPRDPSRWRLFTAQSRSLKSVKAHGLRVIYAMLSETGPAEQ